MFAAENEADSIILLILAAGASVECFRQRMRRIALSRSLWPQEGYKSENEADTIVPHILVAGESGRSNVRRIRRIVLLRPFL
jgi:hypothetical protein